MPFGMKNAPATFQRLINSLTSDLEGCKGYIDVVVYSDTWKQHVQRLWALLERLAQAKPTVNLPKSKFGHAQVVFLGHVIGQGCVTPVQAKVEAIATYPVPTSKQELMCFLGMAGYYRKFYRNFSIITASLTTLLKKREPFVWSIDCQRAIDRVKAVLQSFPVLQAPDSTKQFKLVIDASDLGAGAVLQQEDSDNIDHSVCYFSKKFDEHQQKYSTIEKEALSVACCATF